MLKRFIIIILYINIHIFSFSNISFERLLNYNDNIYINIEYSNNFKFNNKIVLFDLTQDLVRYQNMFDSTDDLMNSGKFVYLDDEITRMNLNIEMLTKSLILKLNEKLVLNHFSNNIIKFMKPMAKDDDKMITITLFEYSEGEYNLIKNQNTRVKIKLILHQYDTISNGIVIKNNKKYIQKSMIEYPTENKRIINLSDKIADEIVKFLKRKYPDLSKYENDLTSDYFIDPYYRKFKDKNDNDQTDDQDIK